MGNYNGISFSVPTDTTGMLTEQPKSHSKAYLSPQSLSVKLKKGIFAIRAEAIGAGHGGLFANAMKAPIVEGAMADIKLKEAERIALSKKKRSQKANGGEANMRFPNRASFAADKSFRRGEEVVHSAGHARGVVLGPSRSKPGMLKVMIDGEVYRVPPKNLQRF